ncbi:MAG: chorismate-binding protein [Bacteroidota bacterium]
MREFITYASPTDTFLSQLLQWTRKQQRVCFLDSSRHPESSARSAVHSLIAVGAQRELMLEEAQGAFDRLKAFHAGADDWLFGYLSYDLKNDVEDLTSLNPDGVGMPVLHFFQPEWVFLVSASEVRVGYWTPLHGADDATALLEEIRQAEPMPEQAGNQALHITPRLDRATYLERVRALQRHIRAGDIYEANFCQEFFATDAQLDPYGTYHQLNRHAPSPFSCFYRLNDHYLMCGSPERFLRKRGDRLISQPIKGTARRGKTRAEDRQLKAALQASTKDRSENVMIVDLVRNDLSRSAAPGSVTVEELFGIYSFPLRAAVR